MTDDIPDRLRTLAAEPEHYAWCLCVVCIMRGPKAAMPPTAPTADDRERLRAWLDRPPTRETCGHDCDHWKLPPFDGRDFERDCTCNPGPVPVEGGFVWRHCSCGNFEEETR